MSPDLTRLNNITFRALTDGQIQELHGASLEILERTGVRFYNSEALALLRKAGAHITDRNLVHVCPGLVEWALTVAPKKVAVFDRDGQLSLLLDTRHTYFGPGSDCSYIYDLQSGQRRLAAMDDVVSGIRLVDALSDLDFVMSMFLPNDVPDEEYERHQMAAMLRFSRKPIVFVGNAALSTPRAIDMASIVAGGLASLQERPFIINYVNTVSAFHHNDDSVRRLMYAAERNIPSIYSPGMARGLSAPMTQAGALALSNAGQLAGLVLAQLTREGSPFIRSNPGGDFDMRTMVSLYAAPDRGPFGWELGRHYGMPVFGTAGCSDAKVFDAQAASEAALTLFANAISGATLVHDVGYLDCATTGSLQLVAHCDELIGWIRRFLRPLDTSPDALAADVTQEVGPDEQFLQREHTLRHVRDDWRPTLADRLDYPRWAERGGTTLEQRARQKVIHILSEEPVSYISADARRALQKTIV